MIAGGTTNIRAFLSKKGAVRMPANPSPEGSVQSTQAQAARTPNFLSTERSLLERFMPGLDDALKAIPLSVLESRENPSIKMLKEAKGPALLIPKKFGGMGATPVEGVRVLRE